mmetsp:Transcript_17304/g.30173  ORF Transcript_17304/g.30173 Transcript_17304/m.30173 type:complete len:287 (-) Transcript_17304:22-882(-)
MNSGEPSHEMTSCSMTRRDRCRNRLVSVYWNITSQLLLGLLLQGLLLRLLRKFEQILNNDNHRLGRVHKILNLDVFVGCVDHRARRHQAQKCQIRMGEMIVHVAYNRNGATHLMKWNGLISAVQVLQGVLQTLGDLGLLDVPNSKRFGLEGHLGNFDSNPGEICLLAQNKIAQQTQCFFRFHIRYQAQVDLGVTACRDNPFESIPDVSRLHANHIQRRPSKLALPNGVVMLSKRMRHIKRIEFDLFRNGICFERLALQRSQVHHLVIYSRHPNLASLEIHQGRQNA